MIAHVAELLQRTRQHHAIEHATLHVLTARHPNCGTNLVTSAVLISLIALLTNSRRFRLERFVTTLLCVTPALLFTKDVGMYLQGYTTSAEISDRWVAAIHSISIGGLRAHRVLFE